MNFEEHFWQMKTALTLADKAYREGEVPVGCVVVDPWGKVVGKGHNLKEKFCDATLHAEMVALKAAAKSLGSWRLMECSLYVTLEPCPMCLAAMIQFRIGRLFFGAYDSKGGGLSLGLPLHQNPKLNHRFPVVGGFLHYECSKMMSDFFRERRKRPDQYAKPNS
ncbi:MAG: nucleoside deaminase [Bacteriovoracales bacterium]|nr:nucleoside deaminase [Bacteriovoracales bacterium]